MSAPEFLTKWEFWVNGLASAATTAGLLYALYRDKRKPDLRLEVPETFGTLTKYDDGRPVYYWHLRVVNKGRAAARRPRAFIKAIHKRREGRFRSVPLPVPVTFQWALGGLPEIVRDWNLDFGTIVQWSLDTASEAAFVPALATKPNDFRGSALAHELVRYSIELVAEDYVSRTFVVEVCWEGGWRKTVEEMREIVHVSVLSAREAAKFLNAVSYRSAPSSGVWRLIRNLSARARAPFAKAPAQTALPTEPSAAKAVLPPDASHEREGLGRKSR